MSTDRRIWRISSSEVYSPVRGGGLFQVDDFLTTWITDPDGYRIELVQWPADHSDGLTAADWPD
jgi:hypothetical protein